MRVVEQEERIPEHIVTKITYVAYDGKQFDSQSACIKYEGEHMLDELKCSANVIVSSLAGGHMPFDGLYHDDESYSFVWCKPLNAEGSMEIERTFGLDECELSDMVGKWLCIEYSAYDAYVQTLDSCIEYAKSICDYLREADSDFEIEIKI